MVYDPEIFTLAPFPDTLWPTPIYRALRFSSSGEWCGQPVSLLDRERLCGFAGIYSHHTANLGTGQEGNAEHDSRIFSRR